MNKLSRFSAHSRPWRVVKGDNRIINEDRSPAPVLILEPVKGTHAENPERECEHFQLGEHWRHGAGRERTGRFRSSASKLKSRVRGRRIESPGLEWPCFRYKRLIKCGFGSFDCMPGPISGHHARHCSSGPESFRGVGASTR